MWLAGHMVGYTKHLFAGMRRFCASRNASGYCESRLRRFGGRVPQAHRVGSSLVRQRAGTQTCTLTEPSLQRTVEEVYRADYECLGAVYRGLVVSEK